MSDIDKLKAEIRTLERSVERERRARKDAEDGLRNKIFELIGSQKNTENASIRLRQALMASKVMVWEWLATTDCFILYTTDESGVSETAISAKRSRVIDSILPSHKENFLHAWYNHIEGRTSSIDMRVERKSRGTGKTIWAKVTGKAIETDKTGKVLRMVGTYTDVTKQVNERKMHNLITSSFLEYRFPSFAISITDNYIESNAKLCELLELDEKISDCEKLQAYMPIDLCIMEQAAGNRSFIADVTTQTGKVITMKFRLSPMSSVNGKYVYCVGTFQEIAT